MPTPLDAYRSKMAEQLACIDMRAIPGFGVDGAPIGLELADVMVLPKLRVGGDSLPLGDVLVRHSLVVIQGEPGSGKSTLLSFLALAYARDDDGLLERIDAQRRVRDEPLPHDLVPVLLRMSGFVPVHGHARELVEFMREQLGAPAAGAVMEAVLAGHGLVCLDGLDEVGDPGTRLRVVRAIEAWTREYPGRCWVTTRKHGALTLERFSACEIEPFERKDLSEYLERRERLRTDDLQEARARADAWLARVGDESRLPELLRVPLLLVLALAVKDEGRLLPAERVALYESVIETLVEAWNRDRRSDALRAASGKRVDARAIRRALARIALVRHETGQLAAAMPYGELCRLLERELGDRGEAEAAIEVLADQAGLLVRQGKDLRFWHVSFGEYLAATALAEVARGRPHRLLRAASSSEGREVVRMAISWARSIDHDPALAAALFGALLAEESCGRWARLFGVPVRLAVDCVRDGLPLDDKGFSRVLARVLALVERAPSAVNAELLAALVATRPRYECPPPTEGRLLTLVRVPSFLSPEVSMAVTRWIARVAPRSSEARAYCEEALTRGEERGRVWAAIGLLRAGDVRLPVCAAVFASLVAGPYTRSPSAAEIADEIAEARERLRPALRAQWAGLPSSGEKDEREERAAVVALLAVLADDGEDVLAAHMTMLVESERLSSREACSAPLRWLARHSAAARKWLGEALFDQSADVRGASVEVLRVMFGRTEQAGAAVEAVLGALRQAPERLPRATDVLASREPNTGYSSERTVFSTLRWLVACDRDFVPFALARGWWTLPASTGAARWLLAALLWESGWRQFGSFAGPLAECLYAGAAEEDPAIAVTSACLLTEVWEHLDAAERGRLIDAWRAGLRHPGALAVDEPVGLVCRAAWRALRGRFADDAAVRAALLESLASEHAIEATIAAGCWLPEPQHAPRCREILTASLRCDDLQRAFVALSALERSPALLDDGLIADACGVVIRLVLAGWTERRYRLPPPRPAMVELFLATRCAVSRDKDVFSLRWLDEWAAELPEALDLAFDALASGRPGGRAVELLATCLRSPERVDRLIGKAAGAGVAQVDGAVAALRRTCIHAHDESPLRAACERGLLALLRGRLRGDDLAAMAQAAKLLEFFWIDCEELPAARGRLLDAGESPRRIAALRLWLDIQCEPEMRELFARRWFERGTEELVAALRPCLDDPDPRVALEAGLLLRRLTGETAGLRAACDALLAAPGVPSTGFDVIETLAAHLETERARELLQVFPADGLDGVRRAAALVLDDLGEPVFPVIVRLFADPEAPGGSWRLRGLIVWSLGHRPDWRADVEPWFVRWIAEKEWWELREIVRSLREQDAVTPAILAALAARWPTLLCAGVISAATFEGFVAGPEAPDPTSRQRWRVELSASDADTRERAALALGMCEPIDDELAEALIEAHFAWRWPGAGIALECLRRPENAAVFGARRRARAQAWRSTPEDAAELLMLWSNEELAGDSDVTLPLLRAAASREDAWAGFREALLLASLDRPAALSAMRALAPRSTEAAHWLVAQGHTCPQANERLWWALRHHGHGGSHWELALEVLLPTARDDPRLLPALERIAVEDRHHGEQAIWVLAELSRERTLVTCLERLAGEEPSGRQAVRWLAALARECRPGRCPIGWTTLPEPTTEGLELDLFNSPPWGELMHVRTLDEVAGVLAGLAPTSGLDLDGATVLLLGGEPGRWSALWRRAEVGEVGEEEFAEIRAVVDLQPEDSPGQRLARLYWRNRLSEQLLLDRDAPESPIAALVRRGADRAELLEELLRDSFDDPQSLRRFMISLGLRDELPEPSVSMNQLRFMALDALVRRGELQRAFDGLELCGKVGPRDRRAWEAARGPATIEV